METRSMTEIIVTGCGECPFYSVHEGYHYCGYQKCHEMFLNVLMCLCPLIENPITIKLKTDETT